MRTANLKAFSTLLLSLTLMAATSMTPLKAGVSTSTVQDARTAPQGNLNGGTKDKETANAQDGGPLGIAWPLWLAGVSGLVALMALVLANLALKRVKKQSGELKELKRKNQGLLTRIGGVEVQMEQDRVVNRRQVVTAPASKPAPAQPLPSQSIAWPAPIPDPKPAPAPGPAPVSKAGLINALNAADRQPLREAATAELNITSESENALAMGRAIATELEEVPGGGSYWLVTLQGQHWLFPTDRTLKGFAAAQPAKGLFQYEQQTIAQPQLIEPALLEKCGKCWSVNTMGRIAIP